MSGSWVRSQLALLFGGPSGEGVTEIVEFAQPLSLLDSELLACAVIDSFEPLMPR